MRAKRACAARAACHRSLREPQAAGCSPLGETQTQALIYNAGQLVPSVRNAFSKVSDNSNRPLLTLFPYCVYQHNTYTKFSLPVTFQERCGQNSRQVPGRLSSPHGWRGRTAAGPAASLDPLRPSPAGRPAPTTHALAAREPPTRAFSRRVLPVSAFRAGRGCGWRGAEPCRGLASTRGLRPLPRQRGAPGRDGRAGGRGCRAGAGWRPAPRPTFVPVGRPGRSRRPRPAFVPRSAAAGRQHPASHPPVPGVDPAGLLGVVVDVKDFAVVIPRLLPAIG